MSVAYCLIRQGPLYRSEAFHAGLRACGYEVKTTAPAAFTAGDLLVIWSRYGDMESVADHWEAHGGIVVVAENAYLDPGRHTARCWYALAIGGHNGSGSWPDGGPDRWAQIAPELGAELLPWRERGEHILVCPSRSFGRRGLVMPAGWAQDVVERLQRVTSRPVRVRAHPGNDAPQVPLEADLKGCWAMVVWYSSAGVHSLLSGVPVICLAPAWILKAVAGSKLEEIEHPPMVDRAPAFERLAWSQYPLAEIESGYAFDLLRRTEEGKVPAAA